MSTNTVGTASQGTVTGLTNEMMTYYEKKFLKTSQYEMVYEEGGQKSTQGENTGKVIKFNRYTPLTIVSSALTENDDPTVEDITAETVSATLAEYGKTVKISRFLTLTSIDVNNANKIALVGQNMRESIDQLARTELFTGATAQLAGAKSALSDIAASDVMKASEIRKAVRTLEVNKAIAYPDGLFLGKVQPMTKYDILGDTTWVAAKTYQDTKDLYRGEMGELYQVRFLKSPNGKTTSSTTTVYSNFIHGSDAFGAYDLAGDQPKLYIIPNTQIDSNNPAGRRSFCSWAGSYVVKTLQPLWLIDIKTGATA